MRVEYIVMIVGAGGTGGNFAKEFARYASFLEVKKTSVKTVLIDGDKVEEKNEERQPFIAEDVSQMKAVALGSAIKDTFEHIEFYSCARYINSADELGSLYSELRTYPDHAEEGISIPIVVGAVDNHRARQCMHAFFEMEDTIFYLDSANEYSVGEVVLAAKANGTVYGPDRCFYYPDVLTDTSPSAEEISCGAINESSPQHLATNLMAADLLLAAVVDIISEHRFKTGIIYFDREKYFSRFQPYTGCEERGVC